MLAAVSLFLAQAPKAVADIPFEWQPGRIWIKGKLNGRPASIVLDSGASTTVGDEKQALAGGANRTSSLNVNGNGPSTVAGWTTDNLNLAIDGTSIVHPVTVALSLEGAFNDGAAHRMDAVLGADFLRRFAIEIDYVHQRLRLFDPKTYVPPKAWLAFPFEYADERPAVDGSLRILGKNVGKVSVLVDTGTNVGVDFTGALVAREGLGGLLKGKARAAVGGLGGDVDVKDVKDFELMLGPISLKGMGRALLTEGGAGGKHASTDVILGDAVLSKLSVGLDFSRKTIYLGQPTR